MKEIRVLLPPDMWAMFKMKAKARHMPLSTWITQAALAYERKAKAKEMEWWPSGWRKDHKCIECGALHDPMTAHPESFSANGEYTDYERKEGSVWK